MDCPDLCLEAFWLQELEWVMEDSHKRSCWKNSIGVTETVQVGPVRVLEEFPTVFNCSVLTFEVQ
jgi:hypothetical protein